MIDLDRPWGGRTAWRKRGARYTAVLADAYARCVRTGDALALVNEVLTWIEQSGEREWEAEIHRLQGEMLLTLDEDRKTEAETCFQKAIAVAQTQQAKSLELPATLSLSRLQQRQGKRIEAYELLQAAYEWFTEGFDRPDLQEARTFLSLVSNAV